MIARILKGIFLGAALLVPTIVPATAANLLNTTFSNAQTLSSTGFLKVFQSGSFTQAFFTPTAQTVMISFSAVCSTTGTTTQLTSIKILVNSTAVYPTNQADDVFCSAVGTAPHATGWARHTVVTAVNVGQGSHSIQVQATPTGGGVTRIDNLALLVWN
jgi:hypothetical protein